MGDNMESLEGGCVIVANGRFPSAELPLRLLKEAKTIIACDGAVKTLYEKGIHPDAIVGDLDSIPAGLRERYADRIHHVEDQEINDLTKSVRFAHTQGYLPDCVRIIHWEIYPFLWTMPTYSSGWRCYPTMAFSLLS